MRAGERRAEGFPSRRARPPIFTHILSAAIFTHTSVPFIEPFIDCSRKPFFNIDYTRVHEVCLLEQITLGDL
jgi:hypothetical protein